MHWVVQENLFNEFGFNDMIASLEKRNVPHTIVKVIPFIHELEPDIPDPFGPVFVYGTTAMSEVAKKRGWTPGTFLNSNFDALLWLTAYGAENCLNGDAVRVPFGSANFFQDMFIRPADDGKAFSGTVMSWREFGAWKRSISDIGDPECPLQSHTPILVAPPKEIHCEWRAFVVDSEIVTVSQYKLGDELAPALVPSSDTYLTDWISKRIADWEPSRAYTLDVAGTPDGNKIIEIGNFNASGLYACDVDKIVEAVEGMKV